LRVQLPLPHVQEKWEAKGDTDGAGSDNRNPKLPNRKSRPFHTDEDKQDHGRYDYVEAKKRANAS
jgi:hypothetical protein